MSEERIGTPWASEKRVVATRDRAIHPDDVKRMKKGPPPRPGRLPGEGIPPDQGVPADQGVPPEEGLPVSEGRLPVEEGVVVKGAPGQVDRGAPGQMDPWAENPWAPGDDWDDDWKPPPPGDDLDVEEGEEDFYLNHPNFHRADADAEGTD